LFAYKTRVMRKINKIKYFEVVILKSPLKPLTYQSKIEDIQVGFKVVVPLNRRKSSVQAVVIKEVDKPSFICKDIVSQTKYYFDERMIKIANFISKYYVCSLGHAFGLFTPFESNMIYEKKSIDIKDKTKLTNTQNRAYEFINKHNCSLIFADTGAGKTEIYIKKIIETINSGSQAIFLIPEISLTPQMQERLEAVFGDIVAVWHSKISKKVKEDIATDVQIGNIRVVVGARSALFLPYKHLDLIIVDEEHDNSYKSSTSPRYNAKDLSIYISSNFKIKTILGSATPSISTFYKIPYIRIKEKFYKNSKNYITFIKPNNMLDEIIINKIKQNLDTGAQVIVFVPTRANFKYQVCSDCGKAVECPYCSVSMSLYVQNRVMRCHYCSFAQRIPDSCPYCKTGIIQNNIIGTAEVAKILENEFKDYTIKQFDRDKIKTNKQLRQILNEFNNKKIDIMIGTSMLTKGHDYLNINLVVVLGLDSLLNMDSFQARQLAITTAIQVAGRGGRKDSGQVIIATKNVEFFDYYLNSVDFEKFLNDEVEFRGELYPPKIKISKAIFAHKDEQKAKDLMQRAKQKVQGYKTIQIIKADMCKIFKISNKYRYELVIRSHNINDMLNFWHNTDESFVHIDMDCSI